MTKFVKMSLAAAVAVAGISSTASAKPLEEAIKGVDVSGMVRYRYEHKEDNTQNNSSSTKNDYDLEIGLTAPVNDMVSVTVLTEADAETTTADGDVNVFVSEGFFTVNAAGATIMAGKQGIPGPFDDSQSGTGVVALIPAGPVTLAAGHFENHSVTISETYSTENGSATTNLDGDASTSSVSPASITAVKAGNGHANAYAVIGSFGDIKADAWYMNATELWTGTSLHVSAPVGPVSIDVRHTTGEIESRIHDALASAAKDGKNEASLTKIAVSGKAADIKLGATVAMSGEDNGMYLNRIAVDNDVEAGVDLLAWNTAASTMNDGTMILLSASKAVAPKTTATLKYATRDYGSATYNNDGAESAELIAQVSYKMSKNLNTYFRYASWETKSSSSATVVDYTRSRIEVKYSF